MTNIERAIERLQDVTKIKCGPEFSHHYTVNLNDCRAEIVALMTVMTSYNPCPVCDSSNNDDHEDWCTFAALAAKIMEVGK